MTVAQAGSHCAFPVCQNRGSLIHSIMGMTEAPRLALTPKQTSAPAGALTLPPVLHWVSERETPAWAAVSLSPESGGLAPVLAVARRRLVPVLCLQLPPCLSSAREVIDRQKDSKV